MRLRSFVCSCVCSFATAALPAQGFQCTLLGTFNQHGPFNDIWGYVAPSGKEYALLGAESGLVVVDCSNPATPIERGYFPWAQSVWRDIRTWGTHAYVSSEGAGGFQVIDLGNPDLPFAVGIVGAAQFGNAHNICIDRGTGRIYMVGCNTGTPVFDAAANPANPPFLGYALGSGNSNYFHDLCVENGYGYGSMIYNGQLRILDVSTFPPAPLSNSTTPSAFTHNAWPNASGTLCVTTDERTGGLVRFFDVTDKSAPVALGQWTANPVSTPHNAYLVGNLCHASWYTEGYQCIDVSDPTTPIRVASYDTWPGASGGYNGAWGCYPFQPSGNIYVSDRSTGLYIVRPQITDLSIAHAPLADTTDEDGPYTVLATVTGSNPVTSVTLRHRLGSSGAFTSVAMSPTGVPGQYGADLPGQDAVASFEYHIDAVDAVAARRSPRVGEHRFLVGVHTGVWFDDLEVNLGWTHGGASDDWQRGSCNGRAGDTGAGGWADPIGAFSGANVWANNLGAGANGAYGGNANNWLQSPSIATGGAQGLWLGYRRWLTLAAGDTARVLVNGTLVWSTNAATSDTIWVAVQHDIAAIANGQSQVVVRFELQSNASNAAGGWNVDDVELFTLHDAVPPSDYGAGTPGTGGIVPTLGLSAPALLGTTTVIQGASALSNSVSVLVFNLQPADFPALGIEVLVETVGAALLTDLTGATGTVAWPFAVPSTPSVDNTYLYAQVAVLDPGSPGMLLSASRGLRFRVAVQ
ncbi:MAG TPA: choice-of-anchor B family protein [Planctomycetota bacterium]|nr:choice-of-anchor B family protein [Planctomycetota bacterium]